MASRCRYRRSNQATRSAPFVTPAIIRPILMQAPLYMALNIFVAVVFHHKGPPPEQYRIMADFFDIQHRGPCQSPGICRIYRKWAGFPALWPGSLHIYHTMVFWFDIGPVPCRCSKLAGEKLYPLEDSAYLHLG